VVFGFFIRQYRWRQASRECISSDAETTGCTPLARTAIHACDLSTKQVLLIAGPIGRRCTYSLQRAGSSSFFDFYILSDTREANTWL